MPAAWGSSFLVWRRQTSLVRACSTAGCAYNLSNSSDNCCGARHESSTSAEAKSHGAGRAARLAGMISIAAVVAGVMVFTATSRSGELRTWKSATGTFSTEAELLETTADGAVRLKKKDGKEIKVPLDRLSAADQEYARAHLSDAAPAAKGNGATEVAGRGRRRCRGLPDGERGGADL